MNYKFDSIVTRSEANALKEMIFQRVRERGEKITEDVQSDLMNNARDSFVSRNNPFSQIINQNNPSEGSLSKSLADTTEVKSTENLENVDGLGFPIKEPISRAQEQERVVKDQITISEIKSTMREARETLTNKKSFMGALNFLNSQGAVSLMRTKTDSFEVIG